MVKSTHAREALVEALGLVPASTHNPVQSRGSDALVCSP